MIKLIIFDIVKSYFVKFKLFSFNFEYLNNRIFSEGNFYFHSEVQKFGGWIDH